MPKVNTQVARANIYERGLKVPDTKTKSGKRLDRSKPADENDKVIVEKGQAYYSWAFRFGGSHISTTYPKPQQLTQSEYQIAVYDIQDEIDDITAADPEELAGAVENIKESIQNLMEETQGKLDNMPEGLQQGDTGQLLQERIDACQNAYDELDGIDLSYEEPDDDEIKDEIADDDGVSVEDIEQSAIDDKKAEKMEEWIAEKIEEVQSVSFE